MRLGPFLFYLLAVVSLAFGANIEVNAGAGYEVNVLVQRPLEGTTWIGLFGSVAFSVEKRLWTYFLGPFAEIVNLNPNNVSQVELNFLDTRTFSIPDFNRENWYVVVSPSSEVNLYDINGTCDTNVDALVEGNFCSDCTPSLTYSGEANISVNDRRVCAKYTTLYGSVVSFLSEWNGHPVYLTPVQAFTVDSNTYNFAFLISSTGGSLYVYLTRVSVLCGDGVCDPGEEGTCGDCVSLSVSVSPDIRDVNVGGTAEYNVLLRNTGETELNVSLSVVVTAGDPEGVTWDLSATSTTVSPGSEKLLRLVLAGKSAGLYTLQVRAVVGTVELSSNAFQLLVRSPVTEEEETAPALGGGALPEENVEVTPEEENRVVVTPRGYYIPWLGCISYLHVFSPDEVVLYLNEEKNVPVVVQNAGTCDENVVFFIEGIEENFYSVPEENFFLEKRRTRTLDVLFRGIRPGKYEVVFVAKGYYESRRKMGLVVLGEEREARGCSSKIMLLAPDVIEAVEGEEFNVVLEVSNEGTCIEDVEVKLTKDVAGAVVTIDARSIKLPPGESFLYTPPRLATGEYELYVRAGDLEKTVLIVVKPRSVVTGIVEEIVLQARFAILVLLLLIVLGAISYIRSRYLS